MARPDYPVSIVEFQRRFADEASCSEYLAVSRWPEGYRCPACGSARAWVLERRHLWECATCHRQTSVTAGTVMHGTRTPLTLWFWAAYPVATHTPGISAIQLQRQLAIGRHETAWLILQKLRRAMVAPERGPLRDEVEVDERLCRRSKRRAPRRPGPDGQSARGGGRRGAWGRLGPGAAVDPQRCQHRVAARVHRRRCGSGCDRPHRRMAWLQRTRWPWYDHRPIKQNRRKANRKAILPRAHRTISNVKTWLHGTHRGASAKHLQVYLDEFTFRHNRRRTPMAAFQTLLGLGSLHAPTTYAQITAPTGAT